VVAGREFTRTEIAERLPLAVVNRAGGASLWPGRPASDVIGQQVAHENVTYRVIGVVGDVKNAPGEASAAGLYLPLTSDGVRVTQSALNVAVRFADGVTPDLSVFQTRLDAALGENTVTLQSVAERAAPYLQRPCCSRRPPSLLWYSPPSACTRSPRSTLPADVARWAFA
jgi:hypothetical protein